MGKLIINGQDARHKILSGMGKLAGAVSQTYGHFGRTVVYAHGASSRITKDGISVAKQISFSDEIENMGAQLIREAAEKSNAISGDGSSLTTILTYEFCKELSKLLDANADVNQLRKGFIVAKNWLLNELPKYKIDTITEKDIKAIATVSANGDEEIASYIVEAFSNIGDQGIVTIADSLSREGKTKVVLTSGLEFDKGFASGASVNTNHDSCELENPYIIISSKPFEEYKDIATIFQVIEKENRSVVVFSPSFTEEVVAGFSELLRDKRIQGAMVLIPGLSKQDIFNWGKDLSVVTGSKYIFDNIDLEEFFPDNHCGTCGTIKITRNKTIITDPKYDKEEFNNHINQLKQRSELDDADEGLSKAEMDSLKERIARISGGIATIRIGSLNDIELGEKHDRYEDAVNAVRSAIKGGIVAGGGTTLLRISYGITNGLHKIVPPALDTLQKRNAATSFLHAVRRPAQMLIKSAGEDPEIIIPDILKNKIANYGFNAVTGEIEDLIEEGIVDPYSVIRNAVVYSASVAEVFMSLNLAIISDIKNLNIVNQDPVVNPDRFQF